MLTALDVLAVEDELHRVYAPTPQVPHQTTAAEVVEAPRPDRQPKVFISYSHGDKTFVRALVDELQERGVKVWIDEIEIVVGDSLIRRISDAIAEGDFVVGVISEHSVESAWCQKELALAITQGINEKRVVVLPVRLGSVTMPSVLADLYYAEGKDPSEIARSLEHAIEAHLRRSSSA